MDRVLDKTDVMLGLVDPIVFNRTSARNVLLTAYRWKVPLVGISPAYVRSGAIAAVYSTPAQLGAQVSEIIRDTIHENGQAIPTIQYPKYFRVAVNYQVAESMGLYIASEDELQEILSHREGAD